MSDNRRSAPDTSVQKHSSHIWKLKPSRELKATILLTGHYKASTSLLRGVIETFLAGMYFNIKILEAIKIHNKDKINETEGLLTKFIEGNFKIPEEDQEMAKQYKERLNYGFYWNGFIKKDFERQNENKVV